MTARKDPRKAIIAKELPLRAADLQERHKAQGQLELATYRGLMLANGGAIIGLFTFIGNNPGIIDTRSVWWGFTFFVAGIALVIGATVLSYFAEGFFSEYQFQEVWWAYASLHDLDPTTYGAKGERAKRIGRMYNYSAWACVVCSLLTFVVGAAFVLGGVVDR